jgi:hypothetical protein
VDDEIRVGALRLVRDHAAAAWVIENAIGGWKTIGSLLPTTFEAYAEIFHPAHRVVKHDHPVENSFPVGYGPGITKWHELIEVRWNEVARANQRTAHALMDWVTITGDEDLYWGNGSQPGIWDKNPEHGSLPSLQRRMLVTLLDEFTGTPDRCWFAVWVGMGPLAFDRDAVPTFEMPGREMALFSGPLSAATTSFASLGSSHDQSASLWWPDDQAWCVATDVDLVVTYVGGSERCIDAITSNPALESYRIPPDLPTSWDKDTVNPPVPESSGK